MVNNTKDRDRKKSFLVSILLYRLSQFVGFLISIDIFATFVLVVALYVSTFFLFNKVNDIKEFIFDYKVHGIIFSTILSVLAGRIINQFYDKEKDAIAKPFTTKIQQFLKQKYYLYSYIGFNILSLVIAYAVSYRVLIFFLIYQFFIWFYSHKLSKVFILNNLTFVSLTLYPFFGVLFYYQTFSLKIFFLAVFLFIILWILDIVKDILTKKVDKVFGYQTIPNILGIKYTKVILALLFSSLIIDSFFIVQSIGKSIISIYFFLSGLVAIICILFTLKPMKYSWLVILNLLRLWVFIGIIFMLIDGLDSYFQY